MAIDLYDKYIKLHIPFNRAYGGGSNSVLTEQSYGKRTITVTSASASNAKTKYGDYSCYLNGTAARLVIGTSSDWNLYNKDFTVEAWVYPTNLDSSTYRCLCHCGTYGVNDAWGINLKTTNLLCNPGATPYVVSATLANGQWYHIVLASCTSGTRMRFYLDGVQQGSDSTRAMDNNSSPIAIGCVNWNNPSNFLCGYIQDFRITVGACRYPSNFTPPTEALPLPEPPNGIVVRRQTVQPFCFLPHGV